MDRVISEYSLYQNIPKYYSRESIAIAVDGTPLQYSTWEQYNEQDMTKFFALYTEHPCIEYLTKMNLTYFVKAKLYGMRTYDAINWRGKTIEQILRLKKQDIRRFLECYPQIKFSDDALALRLYQLTLNDSDRPTLGSLGKLSDSIEVLWPDLKRMFKYQSVVKCVKYVERQFQRGKKEHYRYRDSVLRMWKDYMEQCKMLEFDLSRIEVVFPHDLHAAHENTTSQVKISLSDIEKRKIAARFKTLERRYHFEFKGFVLRPAKSANEIIEEGKKLHHCVGGYAQRHADGKTNILMIRKVSAPNEPFYTMEIKNNKIVQCYGMRHSLPAADLQAFIEAFKAEKIAPKPKTVPLERQEVAV
ncbi:PcfJ domain-containing protein [Paenibacillus antibioticophila]|uniref:PcfJ domain-containing protein n=1 Tax=Paenibacillus antibioticophila TaxID=1274374 RepID=UPI00130546E0|nr:PcfJ domain-containing protein [Paenibacillus antibioticophila]